MLSGLIRRWRRGYVALDTNKRSFKSIPVAVKVLAILIGLQLVYYVSYKLQTYPVPKSQDKFDIKAYKKLISDFDADLVLQKANGIPASKEELARVEALLDAHENTTSKILSSYFSENKNAIVSEGLGLVDKCDLYFHYLHSSNTHDWDLDNNLYYAPEAFDKESYLEDRKNEKLEELKTNFMKNARKDLVEKLKKQGKKLKEEEIEKLLPSFQGELNQTTLEELQKKYSDANKKNLEIEQDKFDRVSNLRIFGRCYFDEQYSKDAKLKKTYLRSSFLDQVCQYSERNLFSYLSFKLPIFTRWNGKTYHEIPIIDNIKKNDAKGESLTFLPETAVLVDPSDQSCFLTKLRNSLNGKGIVVSASNSYVHEVARLIRVLRVLGNDLPIQVIHSGDISQKNVKRIVNIARDPFSKVMKKLSRREKFSLYNYKDYIDHDFPVQEVWFVDIKQSINPSFQEYFESFANKLLAYLFSSFDETVIMDTDSVPLVPIQELLSLDGYQEHGAMFFKDRDLDDLVWFYDTNLWKKLMPTVTDEEIFGIPHATNYTLKNRYLGDDRRHYMEAGLVMVKRSTHFTGILMSLEVNLWGIVSYDKVWGEKEFFWLGQSLAGNENYYFNKNPAGAAGEYVQLDQGRKAKEMCSTHPAHIWDKDNSTLLWINSGFQNCKKGSWNVDIDSAIFKDSDKHSKKKLKKYYQDYTRIKAVIVPPLTDYSVHNTKNEPIFGWDRSDVCEGFTWCAYDLIGGSGEPDDRGLLIEYDNATQEYFGLLGEIWNLKVA